MPLLTIKCGCISSHAFWSILTGIENTSSVGADHGARKAYIEINSARFTSECLGSMKLYQSKNAHHIVGFVFGLLCSSMKPFSLCLSLIKSRIGEI